MKDKKEIFKKFDKQFPLLLSQADEKGGIDARPYIHDFIEESIQQAEQEILKKVLGDLPKEGDGICVKPEYYESSGWKERDSGRNQALKEVKHLLASLQKETR